MVSRMLNIYYSFVMVLFGELQHNKCLFFFNLSLFPPSKESKQMKTKNLGRSYHDFSRYGTGFCTFLFYLVSRQKQNNLH